MDAAAEEQAMEVEALESIYMEQFTKTSDAPLAYEVALTPDMDENHVGVTLLCAIPAEYPEAAPAIAVRVDKGLGPKHATELDGVVASSIEENMGMAMVFTVAEAVKEWLQANNEPGLVGGSMHDQMERQKRHKAKADAEADAREAAAAERAEAKAEAANPGAQKKLDGTPVTVASFTAWRERFEAEVAAAAEAATGAAAVAEKPKPGADRAPQATQLTGRALFAAAVAGVFDTAADDAALAEAEAAAAEAAGAEEAAGGGGAAAALAGEAEDASLFEFAGGDDELDDLDDLSDDEEDAD
jgi:hypothetical protein